MDDVEEIDWSEVFWILLAIALIGVAPIVLHWLGEEIRRFRNK